MEKEDFSKWFGEGVNADLISALQQVLGCAALSQFLAYTKTAA